MENYEEFLVNNLSHMRFIREQVIKMPSSIYNRELIDFLDYQMNKIEEEISICGEVQ